MLGKKSKPDDINKIPIILRKLEQLISTFRDVKRSHFKQNNVLLHKNKGETGVLSSISSSGTDQRYNS